MQVIPKKRRLQILTKLLRRVVPSIWNQPDTLGLFGLPLPVKPWACHHEVCVIRIVLFRMSENLPRTPRIFLVPESRHVQIRHRRGMQLSHPSLTMPARVKTFFMNFLVSLFFFRAHCPLHSEEWSCLFR